MSNNEVFMGLWKLPKIRSRISFVFLTFRWRLGQPFCMIHFRVLVIVSPAPLGVPRKNFTPPPPPPPKKIKLLHLLCDFDEIWNTTFSHVYNNNLDRNFWIEANLTFQRAPPPPPHLLKKVKFFINAFWSNLKHNIFICLSKITEIEIYE